MKRPKFVIEDKGDEVANEVEEDEEAVVVIKIRMEDEEGMELVHLLATIIE